MKLLKIRDSIAKKKDAFSEIKNLTGKIADKTLEQLDREGVFVFPEIVKDAEDITRDQMIIVGGNRNEKGYCNYYDCVYDYSSCRLQCGEQH